jgi:hypothetical protein
VILQRDKEHTFFSELTPQLNDIVDLVWFQFADQVFLRDGEWDGTLANEVKV